MWEVLTWELPWGTQNPWQVVTIVMDGGRLEVPAAEALPGGGGSFEGLDAYVALIRKCWAQNPLDRPTFSEVIAQLRDLLSLALQKNAAAKQGAGSGPANGLPAAAGAGTGSSTPEDGATPSTARASAAAELSAADTPTASGASSAAAAAGTSGGGRPPLAPPGMGSMATELGSRPRN